MTASEAVFWTSGRSPTDPTWTLEALSALPQRSRSCAVRHCRLEVVCGFRRLGFRWDGAPMSYTVKLAIFPPWKAPVPYETLTEVFATGERAAEAGAKALEPII